MADADEIKHSEQIRNLMTIGDRKELQRILQEIGKIDIQDEYGNTPLIIACQRGDFDSTQLLLNIGANPAFKNLGGDTPLICAARQRDNNDKIIRELVKTGVDINERGGGGSTALIEAASHDFIVNCRCLIELGADINLKNNGNETALSFAIAWGYLQLVKLFIASNVNLSWNESSPDGCTYLEYAESKGNAEIVKMLKDKISS